jgi:hypothetical protein
MPRSLLRVEQRLLWKRRWLAPSDKSKPGLFKPFSLILKQPKLGKIARLFDHLAGSFNTAAGVVAFACRLDYHRKQPAIQRPARHSFRGGNLVWLTQ